VPPGVLPFDCSSRSRDFSYFAKKTPRFWNPESVYHVQNEQWTCSYNFRTSPWTKLYFYAPKRWCHSLQIPPQHFATTPTPTQYPTPPLMPARPRTLIPVNSLTTWLAPSGPSLACSPPPPSSRRPLLSSHLRRRNAVSQIHLLAMHLPSCAPYISSLPHEPSDPSKRHRALGGGRIYVL
jgi:hypothetical protein